MGSVDRQQFNIPAELVPCSGEYLEDLCRVGSSMVQSGLLGNMSFFAGGNGVSTGRRGFEGTILTVQQHTIIVVARRGFTCPALVS
jgi:hypothetical protein